MSPRILISAACVALVLGASATALALSPDHPATTKSPAAAGAAGGRVAVFNDGARAIPVPAKPGASAITAGGPVTVFNDGERVPSVPPKS